MSRIWIEKGLLIRSRIVTTYDKCGEPLDWYTALEYQVYELDGSPASGSYRGAGESHGDRILIGDPQYQSNIAEYLLSVDPTPESEDRFRGFLQAIDDKKRRSSSRTTKATADRTSAWWDGYRDGWAQKDERKASRVSNPKRERNLLSSRAPCELEANTIRNHPQSDKLEIHERGRRGDGSIYAHDIYLEGVWLGTYWFCLNRPDEDGWNWMGPDKIKHEHTGFEDHQARNAILNYTGYDKRGRPLRNPARETNPRAIAQEFVEQHCDDRVWEQRIPGGTEKAPCDFDRLSLMAGLEVELEHTTDPAIALEIAMDHLDEDPTYYRYHEKQASKNTRARNPSPSIADPRAQRLARRIRFS